MVELYNGKYRIPTTRLGTHHYNNGVYFVTICVQNRLPAFGEIIWDATLENVEVQLSQLGKEVKRCIGETEKIREGVRIPILQIMPDHVHFIIDCRNYVKQSATVETRRWCVSQENTIANDETHHRRVSTANQGSANNVYVLSNIVNQIKGTITRYARANNIPFSWQPRFWEHIIHDEHEFHEIAEYITQNPLRWVMKQINQDI